MTLKNTMTGNYLLREDNDSVATIIMDTPERRNALSSQMMEALHAELEAIATDRTIHAVILAANGPVFCAGHDLKELKTISHCDGHAALFAQCSDLMVRIVTLPQPVIARVHGMATAAGCQLVASCDLAVATQSARFATPGVNIGLFCSTPMVALSRNIGRKHAMRMLLTGDPITADQAWQMGLISDVVADDMLENVTQELAEKIAAKSASTVKIGKEAFYRQIEMPLNAAYDYASSVMTANMQTTDAGEGIGAFVEKRPPTWRHE
ncbi:enoyl-CoA hydratase [Thalassospira mesophila]|uniref:Enoyl-CoA hydratase domain-containing protein 3, mitochondrial n=2 Tax=Thalassospira mesophila TaxID=1293891 RepID=A0A1Y2L160_9PROT|nr:enoyl-CoA hydratase [Thalassospira mesophila]OSQ38835.1 enoyl-CoA hydratase [Thalassospira mesophila]